MKKIKLTKNQFAIVDDEDFEELNKFKWHASKGKRDGFYALRKAYYHPGCETIAMQRQIMGLRRGDKKQVDHINHNTLDNRKENLRLCTNSQNRRNARGNLNTSSKFKGVSFSADKNKYEVYIWINNKNMYLGCFKNEHIAAFVYNIFALLYYGEFAYINEEVIL